MDEYDDNIKVLLEAQRFLDFDLASTIGAADMWGEGLMATSHF